jgi:hypothetical protein
MVAMSENTSTIEFSVDKTTKEEILLFCTIRGFARPSDLARYATSQYMRRYALKSEEIKTFMERCKNHQQDQADAKAVPPAQA